MYELLNIFEVWLFIIGVGVPAAVVNVSEPSLAPEPRSRPFVLILAPKVHLESPVIHPKICSERPSSSDP